MYIDRDKWRETEIVFLLEVDLNGRLYRFSTFPIYLDDGTDQIPFEGGLQELSFEQTLNQIGRVKRQIDSISLAVHFPFNVAKRQIVGKGIELAKCQLFFVLVRNGVLQQNASERVLLYTGVLTDPVYGHPNRQEGYVEFSIENEIVISDQSFMSVVLGENILIEDAAFSAPAAVVNPLLPPIDSDGIIDVNDMHRGRALPIVFGGPGTTTTQIGRSVKFGATPAYLIAYDATSPQNAYYIIAGHPTLANTVKMYDNQGNSQDNLTVYEYISQKGEAYSYVILDNTTSIDRSFVVNTDLEYWIEWDDGSGLPSSVGSGALTGGGDLCIWCLNQLQIDYDRERWQSVRNKLNEYVFEGYINDPAVQMFAWLEKNIIAYLPIAVVAGPKGLTPVTDLRLDAIKIDPVISVSVGASFSRETAIEPVSSAGDVFNDLIVRYAPSGFSTGSPWSSYVRSSYSRTHDNAGYQDVTPLAIISYQRFGHRSQVVELDYVFDQRTAAHIANNYMRQNAVPNRKVSYSSSLDYGFLQIGDIITLTDGDIGLENWKCQIVGKRFETSSWMFDLLIEDNPILNNRPREF